VFICGEFEIDSLSIIDVKLFHDVLKVISVISSQHRKEYNSF